VLIEQLDRGAAEAGPVHAAIPLRHGGVVRWRLAPELRLVPLSAFSRRLRFVTTSMSVGGVPALKVVLTLSG